MEPLLNKHEIADLLRAIKSGKVSTDIEDDSALNAYTIEYTALDLFQSSSKKNDEQRVPNFDIILDNFCQNYAISITNQLQRTFQMSRLSIEFLPFQEYLLSKDDLGSIGVLNFQKLKHGALLVFDPPLAFAFIEIMLGASIELNPLQPSRKLTTIELSVLKYVMSKACSDLNRALSPLLEENTSLLKVENNHRLVSITDPESEVLIATFSVSVGDSEGHMALAFPLSTLEPLREPLKDLLNVKTSKQTLWFDVLVDELSQVYTQLIAQSGTVTMRVKDVLSLEQGDIIPLDYNPNRPVRLMVEEQLKFFAQPGTHNGKKAISITGINN